ncbi:M23 family metallopeptidase [Rubrivivax rivuli]|nr:M23 family metallopeptidase [Rubrivivax rivuli]
MKPAAQRALQSLQAFSRQHRRTLVAGAVVLMAGFGITAVAVAPLAPDAASLPKRVVTEALVPQGVESQLAELALQELTLTRSDITRGTDTAEALFARLGVRDPEAASFIRTDATARRLITGRGGKMVRADTDSFGSLRELVARFPAENSELARTHFTRLTVSRIDGRWLARLETAPFTTQARLSSGSIRSSLFAATDESGLPDAVAVQLADIFSTDIDFHRELRKGDTFSVVYEALLADGEPVAWNEGAGRVLAAEFVNAGREHHAVWFAGADGKGAYYGLDGSSKRRAFLASPLEFSRVTSGFAMRIHPIFQTRRAHLGVDYGAPTGTPVRVVGDGVVDYAGRQNGYGNVIEVRHPNNRTTLYAHLSRIDVRKGQRVEQGQRIGAVGATGWATGPHLHFEFRVNGQHQDPLRVAKASESRPIESGLRPQFQERVAAVQVKLQAAETLGGARVRME